MTITSRICRRASPTSSTTITTRFSPPSTSTLDHHNCLEVLIVRGKASVIRKIADELIAAKGVKHGKLTVTTTGKDLPS
jgi:metal-responsive CopG/Arc/MetJ family transcriptional regulator